MKPLRLVLFLVALSSPNLAGAQSLLDKMFELVVAGAECKQDVNNGLICNYKVGQNLKFSIKDAGGSDQVITFRHSDINDDYAAVMYFGCIVVIPGFATKNYGKDDNVYISPKNGRVYRKREECQFAK
jgi:hypothetical protein